MKYEISGDDDELGISYNNELDIACNKFSALFDRYDIKDFVDIYFLAKEFMEFEEIYIKHYESFITKR